MSWSLIIYSGFRPRHRRFLGIESSSVFVSGRASASAAIAFRSCASSAAAGALNTRANRLRRKIEWRFTSTEAGRVFRY